MNKIRYNESLVAEILPYAQYMVEYEDEFTPLRPGITRWVRTFRPSRDEMVFPVSNLRMDLRLLFDCDSFMIPAVSYNGNHWGDGKELQGFDHEGIPYSFACHRSSVPCCAYGENGALSLGVFADLKGIDCGAACSVAEKEGILSVRFPEQEMPLTYADKGKLLPGYSHSVIISCEKPLVCTVYICVSPKAENRPAYAAMLDFAWTLNHHIVKPRYSPETLWALSAKFAKESLWSEENGMPGFTIGLKRTGALRQGKNFAQVTGNQYEAGWCGQNISYAVSLLEDYLLSENQDSLRKGLAVLDSWQNTRLENGLCFVHMDALLLDTEAQKSSPIDCCNLGAMVENYLEAFEKAGACGVSRPEYKETALGICDFILRRQRPDGSFPAAFHCAGQVIQEEGSTGSFMAPALLWAYAFTEDNRYLESGKSAFLYYIGFLQEHGFLTAGAQDSYCIDKESAIPLMSAAIMLYHIEKKESFLQLAELTAYYLSTWQWHHTNWHPKGSLLSDYRYDTFGGTSVSTQHHHMDPFALRYLPYLLRLAELTGRDIWRERALAAWNNASIGVSDGTLVAAGLLRPAGSQDEGFYHTRWAASFSASQWLVAWPGAFRLEALRKTKFLRGSAVYPDGIRV